MDNQPLTTTTMNSSTASPQIRTSPSLSIRDFTPEAQDQLLAINSEVNFHTDLLEMYTSASLKQVINGTPITPESVADGALEKLAITALLAENHMGGAAQKVRSVIKASRARSLSKAGDIIATAYEPKADDARAEANRLEKIERKAADKNGFQYVASQTILALRASEACWRKRAVELRAEGGHAALAVLKDLGTQ